MKLLIIEDYEPYRFYLQYNLENRYTANIITYSNGTDFLKDFNRLKKPDVIIIDFTLPDYTGEELLKMIRPSLGDTKVFFLSASRDISKAVNLIKEGATNYLLKSKSLDNVFWELDKLL